MRYKMNDCRLSVSLLAGIAIAAIGSDLPVFAAPQPPTPQLTPLLVAQEVACKVIKRTAVFTTANPGDPEVLGRTLAVNTAVLLTVPLPTNPPARLQIQPNGFVDYAALDCGRPTPPEPSPTQPQNQKTTACRTVRNTIDSISVFQEPKWTSQWIASVAANKPVYVTQIGGVTTSRLDGNGNPWVEVDLQRTFGKNFGILSKVGWLPNTNPNDPSSSTLVNGCER